MLRKDADTAFTTAHMILSQAVKARYAEHLIGVYSLQPCLCDYDDVCSDCVRVSYELLKAFGFGKLVAFIT